MAFDLYADVILTRDVTVRGLLAGDVGTVVERHFVHGGTEEGYSVEFFDMIGNTVTVATLSASTLRVPTPADRPTVRTQSTRARSGSRGMVLDRTHRLQPDRH